MLEACRKFLVTWSYRERRPPNCLEFWRRPSCRHALHLAGEHHSSIGQKFYQGQLSARFKGASLFSVRTEAASVAGTVSVLQPDGCRGWGRALFTGRRQTPGSRCGVYSSSRVGGTGNSTGRSLPYSLQITMGRLGNAPPQQGRHPGQAGMQ